MSTQDDPNPIELHLLSPEKNESLAELLTAVAHFHRTGSMLDAGHSVNFGRSWLPGSSCEYGLVSLPYLYGPELERLQRDGHETRLLWLVPITKSEVEYKKSRGLEALEALFEQEEFNYLDPHRSSVVHEARMDVEK